MGPRVSAPPFSLTTSPLAANLIKQMYKDIALNATGQHPCLWEAKNLATRRHVPLLSAIPRIVMCHPHTHSPHVGGIIHLNRSQQGTVQGEDGQ